MDSGPSPSQKPHPAPLPTGSGASPDPRHRPAPDGGKIFAPGRAFVPTARPCWPGLNQSFQAVPATRFQPMVTCDVRFLCGWGVLLFCLKLARRRQLEFQWRDPETQVLENVNRLAPTEQDSLPGNGTVSHCRGQVGSAPFAQGRTDWGRRLLRNKVREATRLQGGFPLAGDGPGLLCFSERHCPHCLRTQGLGPSGAKSQTPIPPDPLVHWG